MARTTAELMTLADIRPDVLAKAAQKHNVSKMYTDYREMIEREALDGVVIAVWHAAHYEVAVPAWNTTYTWCWKSR